MLQLTLLRQTLVEHLAAQGIKVLAAWPKEDRVRYTSPLVVAELLAVSTEEAGFGHYLGERYAQEFQRWEERYGQKVSVRFALDLYSPRAIGEDGLQSLMDQVAGALVQEGPAGLHVREVTWGKTSYDRSCEMFTRAGEVLCEGLLCAVRDESGSFLSFEVKGGLTLELHHES